VKLSVLIPAHDEAGYIGPCLEALLASDPVPDQISPHILVLANGCSDNTADIARSYGERLRARGWQFDVTEIATGGKLNALNTGDRQAGGDIRVYLDADVIVDTGLLPELAALLNTSEPRYAGGRPRVSTAKSAVTRAYARFWQRLPFVSGSTVPGFGIFAMNQAGRDRWGDWPDIISDDTFARLQFTPAERASAAAGYSWPMVEGFAALVRVRRRQNRGVEEVGRLFPALPANDDASTLTAAGLLRLALADPVGFCVYAAVALTVKSPFLSNRERWSRGR
jgi:glycosyltransferase involved in cell wall biosynthesis